MNDRLFAFTFIVIAFFVLGFTISRAVFKSPAPAKETASLVSPEPEEILEEELQPVVPVSEEIAITTAITEIPQATEDVITLTIKDTPTGWLNVREGPGITYSQIKKINPGETYTFLEEKYGWYKIKLDSEKEGWIASQYATKSE